MPTALPEEAATSPPLGVLAPDTTLSPTGSPTVDSTPKRLWIALQASAETLNLDAVRTSLAAAASISPADITGLKLFTGSVILEATVPTFAADLLMRSFNNGSLRVLAEISIIVISESTITYSPTDSPTDSVRLSPSSAPTPMAAPPTQLPSGPTALRETSSIQIGYATIGDATLTESRGRRREVTISMAFRAVAGASKYIMQMRSAQANVTLADSSQAPSTVSNAAARRANRRSGARERVLWAPTLGAFPRKEGGSLFRFLWTDLNYSASTEFYTVWFRDIDASRPQPLRCLTSSDDTDSTGPRVPRDADGCLNTTSEAARASTCYPFPSQPAANLASSSSSTFVISPFALWSTRSLPSAAESASLPDVCRFESRSHRIQAFVLACRGDPESPSCDFDRPSRSLLLQISCDAQLKVLSLQDDSVRLSASSCIMCATLDPYGEDCQQSASSVAWSDWECVKDAYDKGCLEVTQPKAELALSMCDHAKRYNFRSVACFGADCSEDSSFTDDVFEFEFKHPSGARAQECWPKPSKEAKTAGTAVAAVVGGTIAATIGVTVLPPSHAHG